MSVFSCLVFVRRLGKPIEMCTGLVRMGEKVRQCFQQLHIEEEMMDDVCILHWNTGHVCFI